MPAYDAEPASAEPVDPSTVKRAWNDPRSVAARKAAQQSTAAVSGNSQPVAVTKEHNAVPADPTPVAIPQKPVSTGVITGEEAWAMFFKVPF